MGRMSIVTSGFSGRKGDPARESRPESEHGQKGKLPALTAAAADCIEDEVAKLKEAGAAIQKIRLSARHELELAKQMRAEAERYRRETETKARSQAQMLILQARLATQRDIEEIIRKASSEIQKVLADIRMIRITAQEELETQRKFTGAARIRAMSLAFHEEVEQGTTTKKKKEPVNV